MFNKPAVLLSQTQRAPAASALPARPAPPSSNCELLYINLQTCLLRLFLLFRPLLDATGGFGEMALLQNEE